MERTSSNLLSLSVFKYWRMKKSVYWTLVAVTYALLLCYIYFIIDPRCYNIFQQPGFVLTSEFFWTHVVDPGGLAVYLSLFIEQFSMFRFWGALFLVLELFLTSWLLVRIIKKLFGASDLASIIAWLMPAAISFVVWSDVKYPFALNMQVLLLVSVVNLWLLFKGKKFQPYFTLLFSVLLYHISGPATLYAFVVVNALIYAYEHEKSNLLNTAISAAVALVYPFIMYKFVLPVSFEHALYAIIPQQQKFISFGTPPRMVMLLLTLPVSMLICMLYQKLSSKKQIVCSGLALLALVCGIALFVRKYDDKTERLAFRFAVAAHEHDWNYILNHYREGQHYERHLNFYYNLALAETKQMGDKMFIYPQFMGMKGLFLDEPMAGIECYPTSFLYREIGLITNSLHFAFEAHVSFLESHYVMRMIIDDLIILQDYANARKYLEKYSHEMFSKAFVADREKFINGVSGTELDANEVSLLRKNHPKYDFYLKNVQNDMIYMLNANKDNYLSNQYLVASALLDNDLNLFVDLLITGTCKVNPNNMPRAYQEALVLYWATSKNIKEKSRDFKVPPFINDSFKQFSAIMSSSEPDKYKTVAQNFPGSYWKYYVFDSPINKQKNK